MHKSASSGASQQFGAQPAGKEEMNWDPPGSRVENTPVRTEPVCISRVSTPRLWRPGAVESQLGGILLTSKTSKAVFDPVDCTHTHTHTHDTMIELINRSRMTLKLLPKC